MAPVHVTSEIGPLRAVLVHTPGRELGAVTPGNREDYLYDDIIDIDLAQREHRQLVAVLERFADVYEVRDLLTELVARPDVREFLVTRALEVVPSDALARRLAQLAPEDLVSLMVEGALEEAGPIARALNEAGYALPPLPNLFFTRDVGIVIGAHSIIGSMRYGVRWTEELLIKALFRYHEKLENAGILYDGSEEKRSNYTLEGGDVHPIRPDLLVLGFSERSSPAALDHLCDVAFEHCGVTDVVVVVMPAERTAIHLDMIFTQLDRELCCVYPPHFVGPERLAVLHRRKKSKGVKEVPNFFAAMQAVDQPLEPIFCGGNNRALQEREQWASACNFFAARPGVVIAYERNEATVCELEHGGVRGRGAAPRGSRAGGDRRAGGDDAGGRGPPRVPAAGRPLDARGRGGDEPGARRLPLRRRGRGDHGHEPATRGPHHRDRGRGARGRSGHHRLPESRQSRRGDRSVRLPAHRHRRRRGGPDPRAAARILQRLVGIAKERGAVTLADLVTMRNAECGMRSVKGGIHAKASSRSTPALRIPRSAFQ